MAQQDATLPNDGLRIITEEELEKHDMENEESQWVMINGLVYDITEYKFEHPGGEDIMLEQTGTDATESFENAGHSNEARRTMKKFVVGKVEGYEAPNKEHTSKTSEGESSGKGLLNTVAFVMVPSVIFGAAYYMQQYFRAQSDTM